ncbi:MAG: tetratricopeptide repeat protein [Elusimicrobia bacterium]|nr:tetratricopeptide repeat protein [Elusimicrobiota bacterium]
MKKGFRIWDLGFGIKGILVFTLSLNPISYILYPSCLRAGSFLFHPFEDDLDRGRWSSVEKKAKNDLQLQALILMYRGRYQEALVSALPASDLAGYLKGLLDFQKDFNEEIILDSFILRLGSRDLVLESGLRRALAGCRQGVDRWLGSIREESPPVVEVYRNRKDFGWASTLGEERLKTSGVIGIAKFHRLMVITPEALAFGYSWQDTLCHEYIHHALKVKAGLAFPLWFQEGMARAYETIWRQGALEIPPGDKEELLLAAQENRLVEFKRMEPSLVYLKDEAEISLAFTQVALAMEQLKLKIPALVKAVGNGQIFNKAFEKVYKQKLEDFEKKLRDSWKREAGHGKVSKKSGALRTFLALETSEADAEKIFLGPKTQNLISLGDQLRVGGNHAAALNLYRQAQEQEPLNPYVLSRITRSQNALGKREEALKTAQELIRANPRWPPGYELLGELYESQGLYKEAIKAYAVYFDFNPYHKALYKRTAFLHIDLGESRLALPYLKQALILDPQDDEAAQAIKALER